MPDSFTVRTFRDEDEPNVLELLQASLGGSPIGPWRQDFFRWKHLDNPFGRSLMVVCESGDQIVGLRAFMRWEFEAGERTFRAVRAVDTATHPEFQRKGIFSRITRHGLELLEGAADFVFNTPNEKSLPGYLKLGWERVGQLQVLVRPRPRAVRRVITPYNSRADDTSGIQTEDVYRQNFSRSANELERLRTPRTTDYLRWRYVDCPGLTYHYVVHQDPGNLTALATYRVRNRGRFAEASVTDVLGSQDQDTTRHLLRKVGRTADVDYAACLFRRKSSWDRGARYALFVPAPRRIALVAKPLSKNIGFPLFQSASWSLSLGDVELF